MDTPFSYQDYLQGALLRGRYRRVRALNEGAFGIVSVATDTLNEDKLVAIKYNTGKLSDFANYTPPSTSSQKQQDGAIHETRSVSLQSKTKSHINKSNVSYSQTDRSDHDVSKSIVAKETDIEIQMLLKVCPHPNINQLIDHFDTYMVFDYCPRGDLHDAIHLGIAPDNTHDVINIFMQLISAIEHCHKSGVYHRDIKPENILITENWTIQLADFGLATDKLICNNFDVGSERYMAPELLEHDDIEEYYADKVDIWSLGICFLNIVFGKSPFKSANSQDKSFVNFARNREVLYDIFPSMSGDLFQVMMHCLSINPLNRSIQSVKISLDELQYLTNDYEFDNYESDDVRIDQVIEEQVSSNKIHTEEEEEGEYTEEERNRSTSSTRPLSKDWHDHSQVAPLNIHPNESSSNKIYKPPRKVYVNLDEEYAAKQQQKHMNKRRFNFNQRKPIKVPDIQIDDSSYNGGLDFNRKDFFTPKADFINYMERANKKRHDQHHQNNFTYSQRNRSIKAWKRRRGRRFSHTNTPRQWSNYKSSGRFSINNNRRRSSVATITNNNSGRKRQSFRDSFHRPNSSSCTAAPMVAGPANSSMSTTILAPPLPSTLSNESATTTATTNSPRPTSIRKHRPSTGPKSIDGKYVPPNARYQYESVFSDEEEDQVDDDNDEIFAFDKQPYHQNYHCNSNYQHHQRDPVINRLRRLTLSNDHNDLPAHKDNDNHNKYIPPHHRRHSTSHAIKAMLPPSHHIEHSNNNNNNGSNANGILKRPQVNIHLNGNNGNAGADKKSVKILTPISSSAPTDSTLNWFNLHQHEHQVNGNGNHNNIQNGRFSHLANTNSSSVYSDDYGTENGGYEDDDGSGGRDENNNDDEEDDYLFSIDEDKSFHNDNLNF